MASYEMRREGGGGVRGEWECFSQGFFLGIMEKFVGINTPSSGDSFSICAPKSPKHKKSLNRYVWVLEICKRKKTFTPMSKVKRCIIHISGNKKGRADIPLTFPLYWS